MNVSFSGLINTLNALRFIITKSIWLLDSQVNDDSEWHGVSK